MHSHGLNADWMCPVQSGVVRMRHVSTVPLMSGLIFNSCVARNVLEFRIYILFQ